MNEETQKAGVHHRRLRYFDIAGQISRCVSTEALQRACKMATLDLGHDYYLFGGYYPVAEGIVLSSNFPDEWRLRYDSQGYVAFDPTVRHCWTESNAIIWHKVTYTDGKQGDLERAVMAEASQFGLRTGISIPVHGAGAEGGMLSLVSNKDHADFAQHDEAGLQIIANAMHEATKRIISKNATAVNSSIDNLSQRETECLSWTAKGKTSWAISQILDVSENTVVFHIRNAIKKLEVTNRSHAVAKAIALSKITPF